MRKHVKDYELIDHGIENSQYFQGCGCTHTDFDDVATGVGNDFGEAIEDCLESLAQNGWDTTLIEDELKQQFTVDKKKYNLSLGKNGWPNLPSVESHIRKHEGMSDDEEINWDECCDLYYYVSIRVR